MQQQRLKGFAPRWNMNILRMFYANFYWKLSPLRFLGVSFSMDEFRRWIPSSVVGCAKPSLAISFTVQEWGCCIVKIYWAFITFLYTYLLEHFFLVFIHSLQCIHCLLQIYRQSPIVKTYTTTARELSIYTNIKLTALFYSISENITLIV